MVSKDHNLSVRRQCRLLSLVRSNLYYQPKGESAENLRFMTIIDKQFLDTPWYGSRHPLRQSMIALPGSEWRVTCNGRDTNVDGTGCGA
jgi:hypothetical protein